MKSQIKRELILTLNDDEINELNRRRMSSSSSSSDGIGFVGLLQILFIGLKLTGYINWSWWWVMSPFIISASLTVLILAVVFAFLVLAEMKK